MCVHLFLNEFNRWSKQYEVLKIEDIFLTKPKYIEIATQPVNINFYDRKQPDQ